MCDKVCSMVIINEMKANAPFPLPESRLRPSITYEITGSVAHQRIAPLLSSLDAISASPRRADAPPFFLWENAPRLETKAFRDDVKCYSHLPNGTAVLDSKWALARLFNHRLYASKSDKSNATIDSCHLATLETHCFRGLTGLSNFYQRVNMTLETGESRNDLVVASSEPNDVNNFPDLLRPPTMNASMPCPKAPANLWVVKDASSNGAGGIWVVGPENAKSMLDVSSSPLIEDHRYVAQRYAWPPVLFGGRKCHVRVYGLITSDERAFVHKRAFLHVANDPFQLHPPPESTIQFEQSVHITNCCANSHDPGKFAGEICADLEADVVATEKHGQTVAPLRSFSPSIAASLATLAQRAVPFLRGGAANNGFEYLGMDFILSYAEDGQPIAFLLEVNAPPSQDTATGLPHAEDLHNDVIRDLMTLWVLPKATKGCLAPQAGGWRCVYEGANQETTTPHIAPSKAVILNKIHWAIFEQKASKWDEEQKAIASIEKGCQERNINASTLLTPAFISRYARQQFPFFCGDCRRKIFGSDVKSSATPVIWETNIFFENAGGAQVPKQVIDAMGRSLAFRHRSCVGSQSKTNAKNILAAVLGAHPNEYNIFLGANASTLFSALALEYVRLGLLGPMDEVIVSSENHLALSEPWVKAAKAVGATIKWWIPTQNVNVQNEFICSHNLERLLTHRTRVVAVTHASNMLGQVRDLAGICRLVKECTNGYGHVIADGVAAAPHVFPSVSKLGVDWYGVSCHKLFGPHLGALCGRRSTVQEIGIDVDPYKTLEIGTINYEACEGVCGLGEYLMGLASCEPGKDQGRNISVDQILTGRKQQYDSAQNAQSAGDTTGSMVRCQCNSGPTISLDYISVDKVMEAYNRIRLAEEPMVDALLRGLRRSSKVRIIESNDMPCLMRLPVISFLHQEILSNMIVQSCKRAGIACRNGTFLSCQLLAYSFGYDLKEGVVRISLLHYNTLAEVELLFQTLESIPGWM